MIGLLGALLGLLGSMAPRLIGYFEERGLIVSRTDPKKGRILAFPDLGTETAPGRPDAPDVLPTAAE